MSCAAVGRSAMGGTVHALALFCRGCGVDTFPGAAVTESYVR